MSYGNDTKIKSKYILGLLLISAVFYGSPQRTFADTLSDQLAASQQKLLQLNQQITGYQKQISQTQAKTSTLKNEVSIYNNQIASTQLAILAKQTQIDNSNLQITQLQRQIDEKNADIANNKQVLAQLVSELSKSDDQYALKTTLGSNNLSDFLDQIQYTENLQSQIYQLVEKIKTLKTQLEKQQHDLQIQVAQLKALQEQLQLTQNSLTTIRNQKQKLLDQTQGLEKNFQKLLSNSKQDAVNLQKEIEDLDNQVRAKLGKTSAIKGTPGILAWPMDGINTQGYGNTGFTSLGYSFHNGIDIAGPPAQPIYAAADGVVLDSDHSSQTFGNWVALKSSIITPNGAATIVTLYAHMQKFIVAVGQNLKQGDLIGYEGNTGNTTAKLYGPERGYHIHFGVYDFNGFGVNQGAYTKIYGPYKVPYGYTYNPLNFLSPN